MKNFFSLILFIALGLAGRAQVVISEIYGGGGNAGSTYTHDFIELFNRGTTPVSLNGWSVQYASATGSTWQVTNLTNVTLQPGQYYLIQEAQGSGGTTALPTPDVIGTIPMSATAGKIALVNNQTALTGTCPTGASIIDFIGFGATANCSETSPAPAPSNTNADQRGANGCTDNNNNSTDFATGAPAPQNTSSTFQPCGGPTATLSATTLTGFGNVCINTTGGPNSFTINGTNLTSANVTVGSLAGYEYATASGGPYTSSLSLTQSGGSYSQQIFVRFNPTAIQSYNGNIVVAGGGATSINVAATGSGVDDMPTVTTGAASSINPTDATVAGTLPSIGCSPIIQYGFEYSTTSGWTLGTGTQAPASNLSGINFSRVLSVLTPATTYYYRAFAANNAGTAYGAEMSFTTASLSPQLTATAFSGFGNVCVNSTGGPNSFTINGTNLTSANVDVAALAGYTYSTTSGGTYTSTLSLTQSGGTFSQQIFVRFSPTAVQSYNGNIVVSGGGASSINVAATGAGVNSAPTVTTGSASAITQNTATAAGSIPSIGCSAVTAYGIEYSTTNGFANGSGTQVPSTNLSGGNFTSALTGLTPSTTYYYKAYATNAGGTSWGAQQSFTTAAPTLSASALAAFGNICLNTPSAPASFTITGVGLTNANVSVGPLAGYSFATTANGTYTASLTLTQPGGAYSQQVFVRLTPTAVQSYNGNIPVSGGGAAAINVAATGAGVNTIPTVTTLPASSITTQTAVLNGNINSNGCSNVTAYGIEYSSINGFADGNGTQLPSNNLQGTAFSSLVTGLVQGATYYYKAYATNNGGTAYGTQQSFTAGSIASGFNFFPNPASPGSSVRITMDNLNPGYHGIKFFNSDGKLVYQKDYYIQGTFINQMLTIPGHLPGGIYQIQVVNFEKILSTKSVLIL